MTDISTEAIARQLYGLEAAGHSPRMGTIPLIKALAAERDALIRERASLIKTKRERLDRLKAERDALQAINAELLAALKAARDELDFSQPEYHSFGMGCGLEDRNITDRYEAMEHGWEAAMERVYDEVINHASENVIMAIAKAEGKT